MDTLFKLGQIAGIAGISLGIIFLIFKQIIAKKIFPQLSKEQSYKILRLLITLLFIIGIVGMLLWSFNPVIAQLANNTKAKNPFGDEQILLNDQSLFFSNANFEESTDKNTIKEKRYLFQIDKPSSDEYKYELITAPEYAERFYKGASQDLGFKLLEDAHVFRIFRKDPIEIETTSKSYNDEKVSDKEFKDAWKYYTGSEQDEEDSFTPEKMDSLLNALVDTTDEDYDQEDAAEMNDFKEKHKKEYDKLQRGIKQMIKHANTVFNELAIVIFDKDNYQKVLTASQNGRKVEPNPLNFLFVAGGTLPRIDILSVKQASVSKDNKIWGFYGQRKFNLVKVDDKDEKELYMDYYRIYTMNSTYIYQITLTYISSSKTPRTTWNDLVKSLQSLKIVQ